MARECQDEREARLDGMSANQRERLARESQDEREARLDGMSANQRERLARESQDERKDRLRMISRRRSERLAMESRAERENRLQIDRERHGTLPLLEQPAVKSKMQKFHQHLTTLETPICSTCCEQFPGLKINSQSGESLACSRNKRIPKLYQEYIKESVQHTLY